LRFLSIWVKTGVDGRNGKGGGLLVVDDCFIQI